MKIGKRGLETVALVWEQFADFRELIMEKIFHLYYFFFKLQDLLIFSMGLLLLFIFILLIELHLGALCSSKFLA
jgi:hypothetical protein